MRVFVSLCAMWTLGVALSAGAGTQRPAPPATPQEKPTAPSPAQPHAQPVGTTITGCLKRVSDMERADGTAAPARRDGSAASDGFVLMDATVGGGAAAASSGTPGMARQRPAYRIKGLTRAQLEPHLNTRVELTGQMEATRTTGGGGRQDDGGGAKAPGQSGRTVSGQPSSPEGTGGAEALRRPADAPAAQDASLRGFLAQRVRVVADRCGAS